MNIKKKQFKKYAKTTIKVTRKKLDEKINDKTVELLEGIMAVSSEYFYNLGKKSKSV